MRADPPNVTDIISMQLLLIVYFKEQSILYIKIMSLVSDITL